MSIDDLEISFNPRLSVPNFETYLRNSRELAKKQRENLTLILMLVMEVLICKS